MVAHRKRGRPVVLGSKRQLLRERQRTKKADKLAALISIESCTWELSSRGGLQESKMDDVCCKVAQCNSVFNDRSPQHTSGPDIISNLRRYYKLLPKADKRAFLAERISTAALPIGSESEDYRGNKIFVFTLETPTVLSRSLLQLTLGTLRNLPKPNQADCVSVCSEFFFFAIGGHHDTLYQDKKRRTGAVRIIAELAPSEPALPRSRYVRKPVGGRAKQDIISHFIIHAARGGLRLPNLSKTVLPYRSVMSTHSAYVRLEETRLDSAAIALAAHYRNATAEDVARAQGELTCAQCLAVFISRIAGEEAAVVNADQPVALVSKQASRYYNRLCGPIGIIPLHDEVAVLQYFRKVWSKPQS